MAEQSTNSNNGEVRLVVCGDAFEFASSTSGESPFSISFSLADLLAIPSEFQVNDVSQAGVANRTGGAVKLAGLLQSAHIDTLRSPLFLKLVSSDGMSISVALPEVLSTGLVVYRKGGKGVEEHDAEANSPLTSKDGGPLRFFVGRAIECKTQGGEVDQCANVKFLVELVVSTEKLPDTHKH